MLINPSLKTQLHKTEASWAHCLKKSTLSSQTCPNIALCGKQEHRTALKTVKKAKQFNLHFHPEHRKYIIYNTNITFSKLKQQDPDDWWRF